ncbi:hypothetical protein ACP70R_041651 [Stipagrostis hirtigluma subsp. patula]
MVLHQVFDAYGVVQAVEILHTSEKVLALVTYGSCSEAAQAMGMLQGRRIYDGCCQLSIEYASALDPDTSDARYVFDEVLSSQGTVTGAVLSVTVSHLLYP